MGFFQDLKEDLSQAVNELVPDEEEVVKAPAPQDLFAAAEESMGIEYEEQEMTEEETVDMEAGLDSFLNEVAAASAKNDEMYSQPVMRDIPVSTPTVTPVMDYAAQSSPVSESRQASDEVATITRNMVVNGDILSTGSLEINGVVNGNVSVYGELNVTGDINGNSEAANVVATNANINGNVTSAGAIKVGAKTVIRGNIFANSAVISGAVKGDIDVHGPVILDSTAIVMGNIKSKAVQINNGAAVEGMCSQCYADVSPSAFFRD